MEKNRPLISLICLSGFTPRKCFSCGMPSYVPGLSRAGELFRNTSLSVAGIAGRRGFGGIHVFQQGIQAENEDSAASIQEEGFISKQEGCGRFFIELDLDCSPY